MRLPSFGVLVERAATFLDGDKRAFAACKASALLATTEGRLEEALALWETMRDRWPGETVGYCGAIACTRALQRFPEAARLVQSALERFPDETPIIAEAAAQAQARYDWRAAAELWGRIIRRPDAAPAYFQMYVYALFVLGHDDRLEEAIALLDARFPQSPLRIAAEAMLATRREDWDRALELWRDHMRLDPENAAGWQGYGSASQGRRLALLERGGEEPEIDHVDRAQIDVVDDDDARKLMLGFESMGSDCEFGLVQRRFGAEPLGLLRFNSVQVGGLVEALAHRFDGMGDPEHTALGTSKSEYFIRDRRWGLAMHTFLYEGSEDAERLHAKLCRRVAFLKDKLLADLAEGRKIFVFSSSALQLDELLMLHAALSGFGDIALLHIRPLGARAAGLEGGKAGEAIEIRPRLFVGFVSRPGKNARDEWNIPFDEWLDICRATSRMRGAAPPPM